MIKTLINLYKRYFTEAGKNAARNEAREKQHNNGYDYCMGNLMRDPTEDTILRMEYEGHCPFDHNEFDTGMADALRDFTRIVSDNRGQGVISEISDGMSQAVPNFPQPSRTPATDRLQKQFNKEAKKQAIAMDSARKIKIRG